MCGNQLIKAFLVFGHPKLLKGLQMWSDKYSGDGDNHYPEPPRYSSVSIALAALGLCY